MIDRRRDLLKIRVELSGILPPIWRELLVPATYSFWDLHVAIQDAMGWLDYHLHEFRINNRGPGNPTIIGIPPEDLWEDQLEVLPGWEIPATDYLSQLGDQAEYEYDFGDGWLHLVTLVSVEPREKGKRYHNVLLARVPARPRTAVEFTAITNSWKHFWILHTLSTRR